MLEMKLINSKCFTGTNMVRVAAATAVVVGFTATANAENVTTVDGQRTFTNAVVVTNYPTIVILKHDGGTSGVKTVNLPDSFLAEHGISMPSGSLPAKVEVPVLQLTNPLDIFLCQHQDSGLTVTKSVSYQVALKPASENRTCSLVLKANGVFLELVNDSASGSDREIFCLPFAFHYGQEASFSGVCEKFLVWQQTATTNDVESFSKKINLIPVAPMEAGNEPEVYGFAFVWNKAVSPVENRARMDVTIGGYDLYLAKDIIGANDVRTFDGLFKQLPELKDELVQKIKNQTAQRDLFK